MVLLIGGSGGDIENQLPWLSRQMRFPHTRQTLSVFIPPLSRLPSGQWDHIPYRQQNRCSNSIIFVRHFFLANGRDCSLRLGHRQPGLRSVGGLVRSWARRFSNRFALAIFFKSSFVFAACCPLRNSGCKFHHLSGPPKATGFTWSQSKRDNIRLASHRSKMARAFSGSDNFSARHAASFSLSEM